MSAADKDEAGDITPEQWQAMKRVFEAALALHPEARGDYLDSACAGDVRLRAEVQSLLEAYDTPDDFLAMPAAVLGAQPESVIAAGRTVGRYRVVAMLGVGGMGQVYLAEDPRLGRKVALKLLPRRVSQDPTRLARFEYEARAASALSHPNVCMVYEIAEAADGRPFIAMERVEGESLREILQRHRAAGTRMATGTAVDVATQIARGLQAAHDAGVVHRDVKPENVMIRPDGLVKVLDFGLAKAAIHEELKSRAHGLVSTEPGMVMGTVQYMSPEQARGLPVDARTDVWSVGAVLYEMLAGHAAFEGATASDIMVAVLEREPEPLDVIAGQVAPGLARVVSTALSKDRATRFPTMQQMTNFLQAVQDKVAKDSDRAPPLLVAAREVATPSASVPAAPKDGSISRRAKWMAGIGLIVLFGVSALAIWQRTYSSTSTIAGGAHNSVSTRAPIRLAVLPFENLGRAEDAYFVDGMADEVRGKLALLPELEVIARSSSNEYRRTTKPVRDVAQELGTRYLLTGTVSYEPGRGDTPRHVRISPELVEIRAGGPVTKWQQPFEVELSGVFQVQADVAQRVALALQIALGVEEQTHLSTPPTRSLDAYDEFLKAENLAGGGRTLAADAATLRRVISYYERAVKLDSTFAKAWARLAAARASFRFNSVDKVVTIADIWIPVRHALALAPNAPETQAALIDYYWARGDLVQAATQGTISLKANPNDPTLLATASRSELWLGRVNEAYSHLARAAVLDPRSPSLASQLCSTLLLMRRYDVARQAGERAIALQPSNLQTLQTRAMVDLAEGHLSAARAVLRRAAGKVDETALITFVAQSYDLGWLLDDSQQRRLLTLQPDAFDGDTISWGLALAQVHALRGNIAAARRYANFARVAAQTASRHAPDDAQLHALLGVASAYTSRYDEAVAEGQRARALTLASHDAAMGGYVQHQLARIYTLIGDHDKAIDHLEQLLARAYVLSSAWLRIDPTFAPLSSDARFQRLTQ